MKRKGASMPPGTPLNGDFHIIMNNNTNNSIIMHNCTRNYQNKTHHQINRYRRYFNYFSTINLHKNVLFFMFYFLLLFCITTPLHVRCDEINSGNTGEFVSGYSADIFTTTEFDYANRGEKKFGDRCDSTSECGFPGSVCDAKQKTCQCIPELPATNQIDKCGKRAYINDNCFFDEQCDEVIQYTSCRKGKCLCRSDLVPVMNKKGILECETMRIKEASINESCFFNEQCEEVIHRTQCREGKCLCYLDLVPVMNKQGILVCETARPEEPKNVQYVDPAMIGILVVMALMFIIICVVLRLFSRARWRENRTIFNTPNPRLMNVSLLRDNKLLHGHERRGSKMSVRGPSRQPSMSSLRPHSPNPSLGKRGSRRGSRGSSNASASSVRSNRSLNGNYQNGGQNEATKPINVHESVTVEITEPKA